MSRQPESVPIRPALAKSNEAICTAVRSVRQWKRPQTSPVSVTILAAKAKSVLNWYLRWGNAVVSKQAISPAQLLLLCRSGSSECVFPRARVLQTAIGGARGLAGPRPFNTLHLPGAACNLILILACLKCVIFHRPSRLVGVENLVAAVKRFHVH